MTSEQLSPDKIPEILSDLDRITNAKHRGIFWEEFIECWKLSLSKGHICHADSACFQPREWSPLCDWNDNFLQIFRDAMTNSNGVMSNFFNLFRNDLLLTESNQLIIKCIFGENNYLQVLQFLENGKYVTITNDELSVSICIHNSETNYLAIRFVGFNG